MVIFTVLINVDHVVKIMVTVLSSRQRKNDYHSGVICPVKVGISVLRRVQFTLYSVVAGCRP